VLAALASHLNDAGATTTAEADARGIVARKIGELRTQGQISGQPEPLAVLDVLTSHHTLLRSGTGGDAISFQHQQIQEWYASREVEVLMRQSREGDASARVRLRGGILDNPAWEESIFFAVDRVSREEAGREVVADAIRLALFRLPTIPDAAQDWTFCRNLNRWNRL
jgi:hypothetical protein